MRLAVFDEPDTFAVLLPDAPLPAEALLPDDELLAVFDAFFDRELLLSALWGPESSLGGAALSEPEASTSTALVADVLSGATLAFNPEAADAVAPTPALAAPKPAAAAPTAAPPNPPRPPCPPPMAKAGVPKARGTAIAAETTSVADVLPKQRIRNPHLWFRSRRRGVVNDPRRPKPW